MSHIFRSGVIETHDKEGIVDDLKAGGVVPVVGEGCAELQPDLSIFSKEDTDDTVGYLVEVRVSVERRKEGRRKVEKYLGSISLISVLDDGLEVSQDFMFGKKGQLFSSTMLNQSVKSILLEEVGAKNWV